MYSHGSLSGSPASAVEGLFGLFEDRFPVVLFGLHAAVCEQVADDFLEGHLRGGIVLAVDRRFVRGRSADMQVPQRVGIVGGRRLTGIFAASQPGLRRVVRLEAIGVALVYRSIVGLSRTDKP
jgi:hypothetical protein